jgi:hypothetical protein
MRHSVFIIFSCLILASCSQIVPEKKEPAKMVDLNKVYQMVDKDGGLAGTVVFKPVGGGEVRDNTGNVIGIISPRQ